MEKSRVWDWESRARVFLSTYLTPIFVSDDGKTWRTLQSTPIAVDPMDLRATIRTVHFEAAAPVTARYLRVTAQNYGMLQPGHEGAGKPAHLFTTRLSCGENHG